MGYFVAIVGSEVIAEGATAVDVMQQALNAGYPKEQVFLQYVHEGIRI